MNDLVLLGDTSRLLSGVVAVCLLVMLLGFWLVRGYYRRQQIQQASKMSKEFRQLQSLWEDQRKALEQDAVLLRADLKEAHDSLDELRREHNRQSAEWQETEQQLGQRSKQLYLLAKQRGQEKNDLDKKLALDSADWRREKEQLERTNLRLRNELDSRGQSGKLSIEAEKEQIDLRKQLAAAQAETLSLQRQIADQSSWAEQVQQTLEEELNRTSEELACLRQEDNDNVKSIVR